MKLYSISCKIKYIELKFNEISLSFDLQYFKVLIVITVCKLNEEISLNFSSIYLILELALYNFLK